MAAILNSELGRVYLLDTNPRQIRDSAFNALCESIERDEDFMALRGILVWQVPQDLEVPEGEKSPFEGQRGKLVVLGGNMRAKALKALGHDEIKREWLIEAKHPDGNWITPEEAERLVLVDNGAIGISGSNDYETMLKNFNEYAMRKAGIDFSEFEGLMKDGEGPSPLGKMGMGEGDGPMDEMENGDIGEKSPELEAFIAEREKTRANLKEIDEAGFHLLLVFPDGFREKAEFVSKCGVFKGAVSLDGGPYLDLVFETYAQKMQFVNEMGLADEDPETGVPPVLYGLFCNGKAFAKKMGVELAESGLHFRDRIVDTQLSELAEPVKRQKSEGEIETEIYERLKAERMELGMMEEREDGQGETEKKGKKGARKGAAKKEGK